MLCVNESIMIMTNQNIPLGSLSIARLSNQNHRFLNILMFPNIYLRTQKHICLITFRVYYTTPTLKDA
jgi:hypothetical protein